MAAALSVPTSVLAQSVPIVFSNDTGMSGSQIWIQFLGGHLVDGTYTDAITGAQTALQGNVAYSLDQITSGGKAQINLSAVESGRIYVSYGAYGLQNLGADNGGYTPSVANSLDPNFGTRFQYMEPTVKPVGGGSTIWADLTYIDFTAISLSMSARNADGSRNRSVSNGYQTTSYGQSIVNQAWTSSGNSTSAIQPSGASTALPNSTFARVISPQFSSNGTYPDFSNYLDHLGNTSTTATISGKFVGTVPMITPLDTPQIYNYTATFNGNATTGNVTLTANAGSIQSSTIVIQNSDLNSPLGIYGNDVPYSVGGATPTKGITNDVYGRVVGDLLAGLCFGYVGSNATFTSANGTLTTIGSVSSTEWWAGGETQGAVPIGNVGNGTVSWLNTPAGQGIYFAGAQPLNSDYYHQYAASLAAIDPATGKPYTLGYGFPLQDRLGNNLLVYNTAENPGTYLLMSINPDGTSALPTAIWTANASGSWGTPTNWAGNATMGNSSVQFVGNYTQNITVDTGGNRSVTGIYFNYASGNFTIANNTITLTGDVMNSSSKSQTITSNLTLGSNSTATAAFGNLVFGGAIALSNSGTPNTLTFAGTQNSTISGIISDGSAAGGSVVKTGSGTLTLNGNSTFSGGLTHQSGTVVLGDDHAAGTGTLTLGQAAAADAVLQASGGARTLANALTIAGNTTLSGSYSFTFTGPVTLASSTIPLGNSTTTFNNFTVTNSVDVELSGAIGQTGPGTGNSFTKAGGGNMTFSGVSTNTFTGGLSVNNGTLFLNKSPGVAAYGGNLMIGDGTGAAGSAVVQLMANNQTPGTDITIGTDGLLNLQTYNATTGNVTMTGGSITGSGALTFNTQNNTTTVNGTATTSWISLVDFSGEGNSTASISCPVVLNDVSPGGNGSFTFITNKNAAAVQMIISGVVSGGNASTGTSSLAKPGSGTLQFTQNSTFNGSVAINGGVMATQNMANASVTMNAGALSPGGVGAVTPISVSNLYASQNPTQIGSFLMDLGATGNSDSVQSLNIVSLGNMTTFIFSAADGFANNGTYTLIKGGAGTTHYNNLSTYKIVSLGIDGLTGSFSESGKDLVFSALAGQTATWNGADSSWGTAGNWNSGTGQVPLSGADIVFSGIGSAAVSTEANRATGSLRFSGNTAYTITDNTIVLGGNLVNNSTVTQTINSNIALNYSRTIAASTGTLSFGGNVALSEVGALPSALTFAGDQNITVIGAISDGPAAGGSLVKTGNGTLTLTGNNTFTGSLTISGGVVAANSGSALGAGEGGQGITQGSNSLIFSGGTLQATGTINSVIGRYLNMQSTGIIDTNGNNVTINGVIQGPGGLTKNGNGSLTLYPQGNVALNSYAGATTVNGGSLLMNSASSFSSASAGTTVNSGGSLIINAQFDVVGQSLTLSGSGDGGNGALRLVNGFQSTWNGPITLSGNSSIQADGNTTLTLHQIAMGGNNLTFTGSNSTINLVERLTGSGTIIMNGTGSSTLNILGSNTGFTGSTTVQNGLLSVQNTFALGNGTASALTVASGSTLEFQSTNDLNLAFTAITLNGTGVVQSLINQGAINNNCNSTTVAGAITLAGNTLVSSVTGNLSLTGNIATAGNSLTAMNGGTQITFSGDISGGGSITANGTGSVLLSGNNSFGGGSFVDISATLVAASNNALGSGPVTVASTGTLQFQGGISTGAGNITISGIGANSSGSLRNFSGNNTIGAVITLAGASQINSASGTLILSNDFTTGTNVANSLTLITETSSSGLTFSGNFTANASVAVNGNGTTTFSGSLLGSQPLTINGAGTTVVSDASQYSGAFNLNRGTLAISNSNNSSAITIGGVNGIVSPGGIGVVETAYFKSIITSSAGAGFIMDLGGNTSSSDQFLMAQGPDMSGNLVFTFNNTVAVSSNTTYQLFYSGSGNGGSLDGTIMSFMATNPNLALAGRFSFNAGSGQPFYVNFDAIVGAAVYDTGTGAWDNNANWESGSTPADGSAVAFSGNSTSTVDTIRNRLTGSITFVSGAGAYTLANNTITTYGQITNNSTSTQTIASALVLANNVSVVASSGNFVLGGNISLSNSATSRNLTVTGPNNTAISGVISNGNATSAGIIKAGNGTLTLSANNTYTGATVVSAGTLDLTGSGNINSSSQLEVAQGAEAKNDTATACTTVIALTQGATLSGTGAFAPTAIILAADLSSFTSVTVSAAMLTEAGHFSLELTHITTGSYVLFTGGANFAGAFTSMSVNGFSLVTPGSGDFTGSDGFGNSYSYTDSIHQLAVQAVPEPATWALLATGFSTIAVLRRRRQR